MTCDKAKDYAFAKLSDMFTNYMDEKNTDIWTAIHENPKEPWDWYKLSSLVANEENWEFLDNHIDHSWNWYLIASYPSFPVYLALKHSSKDWRVPITDILMKDTTVKIAKITSDHPHVGWNWTKLSTCSQTWENVNENCDLPWVWKIMHTTPGFTLNHVNQWPNKQWNWIDIGGLDIMWDIIYKFGNTKVWDWKWILECVVDKNTFKSNNFKEKIKQFNWDVFTKYCNVDSPENETFMLHMSSHIPDEWLEANIHKPLSFFLMSPPLHILQKYPLLGWDVRYLLNRISKLELYALCELHPTLKKKVDNYYYCYYCDDY